MTATRRTAWVVWAVTVALACLHAVVFVRSGAHLLDGDGHLQNFPLITLGGLIGGTVGALIVNRHPRHPVGWLFVVGYALTVVGIVAADHGKRVPPGSATTLDHLANWVGVLAGAMLVIPIFSYIALLFPDGRLPSPRWRFVAWVNGLNAGATTVLLAVAVGPPAQAPPEMDVVVPGALETASIVMFSVMLLMLLVAIASLVVRMRSAEGDRRRQVLWLLVAVVLLGAGVVLIALREPLNDVGVPIWAAQLVLFLGPSAIPLAAGVAIFRYRLYDIEVIVNRALVLAGLVAFVTLSYAGAVVGIGSLVGRRSGAGLGLTLLVTGAVAVAFQPLRRQAQRLADRVVHGRRAAPYEVMAQVAQSMADAVSIDEILPRSAQAAASITGGAGARARVFLADGTTRSTTWPSGAPDDPGRDDPGPDVPGSAGPAANTVAVRVRHAGDVVGDLVVATAPGRPLSRARAALLRDLALACGPALRTVRLTAELRQRVDEIAEQGSELRRSRWRIVASRDEERQVLEEEIDARVLGRLRSVDQSIAQADRLLAAFSAASTEQAAGALATAEAETAVALEQLRDLAGGVFPALLADRGIVAAVEDRMRRAGHPGRVQVIGGPPSVRFAATTEAAIYFCCSEVVDAGARATRPRSPEVRVRVENAGDDDSAGDLVVLEVDGALPDDRRLLRMRDRVEASGGQLRVVGTGLTARLPAAEPNVRAEH